MAVVRGDADAYVHAGGQWEWDSAAPVGVARAAGLHASRLDGAPLRVQPAPALCARPARVHAGSGRAPAGRPGPVPLVRLAEPAAPGRLRPVVAK